MKANIFNVYYLHSYHSESIEHSSEGLIVMRLCRENKRGNIADIPIPV